MDSYHMDVDRSRESEEREGDRERAYQEREHHDENTPTTYERAEPLLQKIMGKSFGEYFDTTAQEVAADEDQADYERDDKIGAI